MTSTLFQRLMDYYGLTTRSLGEKIGVSRTAISQFAHGRLPRVDMALRIAHEFHVTVEELWGVQDLDSPASGAKKPFRNGP